MNKNNKKEYDLICLGGGSGGIASAKRAAQYGAKVLVIEAKELGGTCVNVGCVPKKITWHAAQMADLFSLAEDYGFSKIDSSLAWGKFVKKRDKFIEKLNKIYENGLNNANVDIKTGYAKFIDKTTIEVNGELFTAKNIIIAVGGEPAIPNIKGSELGIDSDDFFAMQELPKSIAIVGSGYIAVEIAGVLNALGVKVSLIVRKSRFLRMVDSSISNLLSEIMQKEGIEILYETEVSEVTDLSSNLRLELTTGKSIDVSCLLWAIGRTPMTDSLGIANTDIKLLKNGNIEIDEWQNTTQKGIYAVGDITGQPTLTPAAIESGRQLAERLFNNKADAKSDFSYVPTVIFSHPAIGTVGITEEQAIKEYGKEKVNIFESQFNPLLRSMTEHKIPTLMKMICIGDDNMVKGIHIIGDYADEIIQGFAVAVVMGAKKSDFDRTLAIHPTSGEELVTM